MKDMGSAFDIGDLHLVIDRAGNHLETLNGEIKSFFDSKHCLSYVLNLDDGAESRLGPWVPAQHCGVL